MACLLLDAPDLVYDFVECQEQERLNTGRYDTKQVRTLYGYFPTDRIPRMEPTHRLTIRGST